MNNRLQKFSFLLATARMEPSGVTATILEQATDMNVHPSRFYLIAISTG